MFVDQPTVEDTISILRGLKERYEVHHGVRIADNALVAAAVLSSRYIADRFLPDKAIDLMDLRLWGAHIGCLLLPLFRKGSHHSSDSRVQPVTGATRPHGARNGAQVYAVRRRLATAAGEPSSTASAVRTTNGSYSAL